MTQPSKPTLTLADIKSVEIYTKPACFFCIKAHELLQDLGVPYVEKPCNARLGDAHYSVGAANREELTRRAPEVVPLQFPQVFLNGQRVGGLNGLKAALAKLGASIP
jgi:glutaredoxin